MDYFTRQDNTEELIRRAREARSRALGDLIARALHGLFARVRHGMGALRRPPLHAPARTA